MIVHKTVDDDISKRFLLIQFCGAEFNENYMEQFLKKVKSGGFKAGLIFYGTKVTVLYQRRGIDQKLTTPTITLHHMYTTFCLHSNYSEFVELLETLKTLYLRLQSQLDFECIATLRGVEMTQGNEGQSTQSNPQSQGSTENE